MNSSRHPSLELISGYFDYNDAGVINLVGSPEVRIVVLPSLGQLAIQVVAQNDAPDLTAYDRLHITYPVEDGARWCRLAVDVEDSLASAYAFLCAVADRTQLESVTFAVAVNDVLQSLGGILSLRSSLSEEKEIGLVGELLVLQNLLALEDPKVALNRWHGPQCEEHDFALNALDLEVKTTKQERREHRISSVTQLVANPGRSLYLISIQLTSAAPDSGLTLPELVSRVALTTGPALGLFENKAANLGYNADDHDLYKRRWDLRSEALFFAVDADFPALTQADLNSFLPMPERIKNVAYGVDLTGLTPAENLFAFGQSMRGSISE